MKNQNIRARVSWTIAVLGACCFLIQVSPSQAQIVAPAPNPQIEAERAALQAKMNELEQTDAKQLESLLGEVAYARCEKQNVAISILREKLLFGNVQSQCVAAYLLGEGRYAEAASSLSEKITLSYHPPIILRDHLPFLASRPAAQALAKIGKPSIFYMLLNMESSDDLDVREWSLRVIREVEGVEVGAFILERAAAKQKDAAKKSRLQAASAEFSKLQSGVRPEIEMIFR